MNITNKYVFRNRERIVFKSIVETTIGDFEVDFMKEFCYNRFNAYAKQVSVKHEGQNYYCDAPTFEISKLNNNIDAINGFKHVITKTIELKKYTNHAQLNVFELKFWITKFVMDLKRQVVDDYIKENIIPDKIGITCTECGLETMIDIPNDEVYKRLITVGGYCERCGINFVLVR